ncbi:MAG: ornithine carbamoyltransferase [Opitutales bacterium]|nr:ornithine carbamoyltransferase [Opitutales bacterium]
MRSFLRETDFSFDEAREVFAIADRYKKVRGRLNVIQDQSWGLIFFKKSTRTRLSFQTGVFELGGNPLVLEADDLQIARGETIEDTAKVMGRYLHGLVIRAYGHEVVEEFKKFSGLPVINALTDALHPCQSYTDIFTMMEYFGKGTPTLEAIKGKKFVFYGDTACNMAYSLALAGGMFGMEVVLSGPEQFRPTAELDKFFKEGGVAPTWTFEPDPKKAAKNADVLYTDVWVSMGKEAESAERVKIMTPYQVNGELFKNAHDGAIFMHCLPAHAGMEVSAEVLRSSKSVIFDEAENRLHTQKAIITGLVKF